MTPDLEDDVHKFKKTIESLRLEIGLLNRVVEELESDKEDLSRDIGHLESEIGELQAQIDAYEHQKWLATLDALAAC